MSSERFPDGFVWGTATAAHQVEGGNWNNDWWMWEHASGTTCKEPSGDACDHYHRYPDDIATLAGLGFGSYRFSVEWSRVEPEPGEFSRAALDHYARMVQCCRDHGIEPVITLHHFTTPRWVVQAGGWVEPETAQLFGRFVERVVGRMGDEVARWCTLNEPNIVAMLGYLAGYFPPGKVDRNLRHRANEVFVQAHVAGRAAVKAGSSAPVGLTLALSEIAVVGATDEERAAAQARADHMAKGYEAPFFEVATGDDYVGVQTYSRDRVGPKGILGPEEGLRRTIMGYEFRPEALEATIRRTWDQTQHTPILVTENGIATENDAERIEFVHGALQGVLRCLDDGIDVRGYTYWSLLDNFEWALGYEPTFGLIAVDRETQERTVKDSARWLGRVAQANALLPPSA